MILFKQKIFWKLYTHVNQKLIKLSMELRYVIQRYVNCSNIDLCINKGSDYHQINKSLVLMDNYIRNIVICFVIKSLASI